MWRARGRLTYLVMFKRGRSTHLSNRRFRELYPEIAEFIVPGLKFDEMLRIQAERILRSPRV
ncbi:MAG: hypothetical protein R3B96_24990 [Pirellulaceae bacterium]